MSRDEVTSFLVGYLKQLCARKGISPDVVHPSESIFGSGMGLDSLDLAAAMVALEQATGRSPFDEGVPRFITVADLADLFAV